MAPEQKKETAKNLSSTEYFSTIRFPRNCPAVPFKPDKQEREAYYNTLEVKGGPLELCKAYPVELKKIRSKEANGQNSKQKSTDENLLKDVDQIPNFSRESGDTKKFFLENFSSKVIVTKFLNDPLLHEFRKIGPSSNWNLLEMLSSPQTGKTFEEFKESINVDRFLKATKTEVYRNLPNDLKDYVASKLLNVDYVFKSFADKKTLDSVNSSKTYPPNTEKYFVVPDLLKNLLAGGESSFESIFKVDSTQAKLFGGLNNSVKSDLIGLLFEPFYKIEKKQAASVFGFIPTVNAEKGLFRIMREEDSRTLLYLQTLDPAKISEAERKIIIYSLLEGAASIDSKELGKRIRYFEQLYGSEVFGSFPAKVRGQYLQASRIPKISESDVKYAAASFDFREWIDRILKGGAKLSDPPSYFAAHGDFTDRVLKNWFLTQGSPANSYNVFIPNPQLTSSPYSQAQLYARFPSEEAVKKLPEISILPPTSRFNSISGLTLHDEYFPSTPYRVTRVGPSSRQMTVKSGMPFESELLKVKFLGAGEEKIRIPVNQKVSPDDAPPDLEMLFKSISLTPAALRNLASEHVVLPYSKKQKIKAEEGRTVAFYTIADRSISFLHNDDSKDSGLLETGGTTFHEYGHLAAFGLLKLNFRDPKNKLANEFKAAAAKDHAEVSGYGMTDWHEDFAESLELYQILKFIPSNDLHGAFGVLFKNRQAFFERHLKGYLAQEPKL